MWFSTRKDPGQSLFSQMESNVRLYISRVEVLRERDHLPENWRGPGSLF